MKAPPFVIINPVSGTGSRPGAVEERVELARRTLQAYGVEPQVIVTTAPRHGYELAKEAQKQGAPVVFAWGGDGTINEIGSALAFGSTPLAIIPAGSGNGLARELRIPFQPEKAFAAGMVGRERVVDVGELGGRLFLNVAGIGFDALVAERFNNRPRGRRGALPYFLATFRELLAYAPLHYEIDADGDAIHVRALLLAIANSRQYGLGAIIAPGAILDDGQLDLVVAESGPWWSTVWNMRRLFVGRIDRAPRVGTRRIMNIVVRTDRQLLVHVDGEPFLAQSPLVARVHPAALRVRV